MQGNERLERTCLRTWEDIYVKIISINARNRGRRGGVKITRAVRTSPPPPPSNHFQLFSARIHLPRDPERQSYATNHFAEQPVVQVAVRIQYNTIQYNTQFLSENLNGRGHLRHLRAD
jgi:hypothetical protein